MDAVTSPTLWSTVAALPDYLLLSQTRQLARHEQALQMLLSHPDPHLTLGGLVARLVRDGLDRYDPERPARARRTGARGSVNDACSASTPVRRDTEPVPRNVVRAEGNDTGAVERSVTRAEGGGVERQNEVQRDDASCRAAVRNGIARPSAAKRATEAERGGRKSGAVQHSVRLPDSAPKRATHDGYLHTEEAARPGAGAASAPGCHRETETEYASGRPRVRRGSGGRAASPPTRHGRTDGDDRDAGVGGVLDRATRAAGPRFEADRGSATRAPVRGGRRVPTSAQKRLADAAGQGAAGTAERSPALRGTLPR